MLKNKILKLSGILLLGLTSCTEPISTYYAELINNSGVDIKILPYRNGVVGISDTLYLPNTSKLEIANGWHRGSIKIPFFESEKIAIGLKDSLVVIFNDVHSVSHFWENPEIISEKCHIYTSSRNVINRDNYEFISKGSKRRGYNNKHFFTFTESDYEFAKE